MKKIVALLALVLLCTHTLFAFVDADNDGMMDSWEKEYNISDPNADPDGDCLTNLEEFKRQSNPNIKDNIHISKTGKIESFYADMYDKKIENFYIVGNNLIIKVFNKSDSYNSYSNSNYNLYIYDKELLTQIYNISSKKILINNNYAFANISDSSYGNNNDKGIKIIDLNTSDYSSAVVATIKEKVNGIIYNISDFYVKDNKLYRTGTYYKNNKTYTYIMIYDISNIKSPILKSNINFAQNTNTYASNGGGIYVKNNILYLTHYKEYSENDYTNATLKIYDISNITNPILESSFNFSSSDSDLSIHTLNDNNNEPTLYSNDILYIGNINNENDLVAINVSDISHPKVDYNSNYSNSNQYNDYPNYYNDGNTTCYDGNTSYQIVDMIKKTFSDSYYNNNEKLLLIDKLNFYVQMNSKIGVYNIKYLPMPTNEVLSPIILNNSNYSSNEHSDIVSEIGYNKKLVIFDYNGDTTKQNKYLDIYQFNTTNQTVTLKKYYLDGSLIKENSGTYELLYGGKAVGISFDDDYFVLYSAGGNLAKARNGSLEYVEGEIRGDSISKIIKDNSFVYFQITKLEKQYLEPNLSAGTIEIDGTNKALYISSPNGLNIYDISTISKPLYLKSIYPPNYPKIYIENNTLYTYAYDEVDGMEGYYLREYNISVPFDPKFVNIKQGDLPKTNNYDFNQTIGNENCIKKIKIPNKDIAICFSRKNGYDSYHYDIEFYSLKAYDKDFDGVPDRFDLYPNDKSRFFLDEDGDGKIDALNPNTNPDDKIYNGYSFDDDNFTLTSNSTYVGDINLFLSTKDKNISVSLFNSDPIFNKQNSYTSYYMYFDNFDSYFVTQLYNVSFYNSYYGNENLINSTSKEDNVQTISLGSTYKDKLISDNSGIDKRWLGFIPSETGVYSLIILKEDGLSSLIKIDDTKEAKITAKIYESKLKKYDHWVEDGYEICNEGSCAYYKAEKEKTLLGEQVLDPDDFSSIQMPLEKDNKYFVSFDLENIKQFKYKIIAVKEYENYFEHIKLDDNGKATYTFITPKSTTYQFILNANKKIKSKLYLGTQTDDAHLLKSFDDKFINNAIGLRASSYTITFEGNPNEEVTFVLGQSDKRKEIEPNNTYQSATAVEFQHYDSALYNIDDNKFQATLKSGEVDFYKIKTGGDSWGSSSTFSVTITPNLTLSSDEIEKYQFNLFVYNSSGDVIEKAYEYLENGSITYNFNVGSSGTYFLRFNSNYDKDFDYTLSTSGTSAPTLTQTEIAYAQKYNSYVLGRGLNLAESSEDVKDNGELIILVGDANNPTDNLYIGSQKLSKNMYNRFLLRGLSHDDIYYLNGTSDDIDLDNDGIIDNVIDNKNPTKKSFYQTIKDRAKSDKKGPLFIYMVDHGANGSFKIKKGDIVRASELKNAIDDFITKSGRKVVVMIEACKSGSFIPTLSENGTRDDILVITSSQAGKLSYVDKFGNVAFSKFLADSILSGSSLKDAFERAKEKLSNQGGVYALQIPQISSGASEMLLDFKVGGDFAAAGMELSSITDYFGKGDSSFEISTLNKNINLFVKIDGSGGVNKVWATVIPPNYQPPVIADDSFETPDMTPYTVELKYNKDSDSYIGTYDKLEAAYEGEYSITYYVEDSDGNVLSKAVKLQGKNIDSTIIEQKNKPVFELSTTYLEVLLNSSDSVSINALGDYEYSVSSENSSIATVSINGKKITIKALDIGQTNIIVTAKNNGYTTTKEFVVKVKESESVKKESISYGRGWSLITSKTVDGINPAKIANLKTSWKFKDGKWLVYTSDNSLKQKISQAGFDSMSTISAGEGGWIYTTNSGKITQIGTPYNILGDDLTNKLHYGWNLIGSGSELSIKNLYAKIGSYGSDIENIWAYRDGKWYLYTKNLFYLEKIKDDMNIGTLNSLKAGEGFWIYVK